MSLIVLGIVSALMQAAAAIERDSVGSRSGRGHANTHCRGTGHALSV